jgi:hypothetical protein
MYPLFLRWRSSLLGIVTAAALLVGQLSMVAHLLIVEHRQCPEHGELVDAAPSHGDGDAPRHTDALDASETEGGHSHSHCLCVVSRREAAIGATAAADVAAPMGPASAVAFGISTPVLCKRWILAPKNSPPRAV